MRDDPIVEEVRRIRDAHAAKFNYDLQAIFQDIKEHEKSSGRVYVSFTNDEPEPQETEPAIIVFETPPSERANPNAN